jgi:hypothetical protein
MWKRFLENTEKLDAQQLSLSRLRNLPWSQILADGALLLAMLMTSSWVVTR